MPLRGVRVLVVDDDPDILEAVGDALEVEHARAVVLAPGVEEAERALSSGFRPDVILLDLVMPGRSGEELLAVLRTHPALRKVAVIAMSAALDRLHQLKGEVCGAFEKPFELEALIQAIARSGARH